MPFPTLSDFLDRWDLFKPVRILRRALAALSEDGISLENDTPATAAESVQKPPRIRLSGAAWSTVAGASVPVDLIIEAVPIDGTAGDVELKVSAQIDGGGYVEIPLTGGGGGITALTGHVAASGTGSVAATIQPGVVTAAMLAQAYSLSSHNHSGVYEPSDADLTAIAALTANGLLRKTSSVWGMDAAAYLTANQSIALTGNVTGSGTTSIATTIGAGVVTNAMLAGSIALSKLAITGTPDATKFLRDDGSWQAPGGATYSVRVFSGSHSLTHDTETVLAFGSERWDTNAMHSTGSNSSRLVAPVAGTYLVTGHLGFALNTTGIRYIYILSSTAGLAVAQADLPVSGLGAIADFLSVAAIVRLAATEYVELVAYQNSGGNLSTITLPQMSPEFAMVRISD